MSSELRRLPSVDRVISEGSIRQLAGSFPHDLLVNVIRQHLEEERLAISAGHPCPSVSQIAESVSAKVQVLTSPSLRPVINATGIVLHTNLGRAPLSKESVAAMNTVAGGYSNLEFDIGTGSRGSRHTHIEPVLCQLTGAEAALVVNNNASAVLLGLSTLAKRKEVIVSRGQAVEIGGSFRIPDVMRQSGAKLIEVGTTNCTYIADYEGAITPRTAALMRVHSSNFQVTGFTHSVTLGELVELGQQYDLPVLDDLGSGCFLDTTAFGLGAEPLVQQSVTEGAGMVFFSGDKLVGGPQAGLIVGQKRFFDKLSRNPLARAARIDKIRLAGISATLIHYLKDEATEKVPVWRMLSMPIDEIERRAETWAKALNGMGRVIEGEGMVGGGSLPGSTLPTRLVAVGGQGRRKGRSTAQAISKKLRNQPVPVIGRISEDTLLLDPRSVLPEDDHIVIEALKTIVAAG
ncbi:MAG: L-seryl-tRNA(Sec) selenium transferase [Dehalococcoidales bacterium]|nr:MAG: L-seryl-tRNA(Sec) selenium transferase [Dehalococcoidales bacterium]